MERSAQRNRIAFRRDTRVLFIGDSITDVGRKMDPEHLGMGYVRQISELLLARQPATAPTILNRGIGGNRIVDLADRWDRDVLAHRPDILSIMIGINDVWRQFNGRGVGILLDQYVSVYESLLTQTRRELPDCQFVLCEPTVLWPPASPDSLGQDLLKPYVAAVNTLGRQHDVHAVVPTHSAFVAAREARPDVDWTTDGCHPTPAGHMLISQAWLDAV